MKSKIFFFLTVLLFSVNLYSKKIEGQIILNSDTMYVTLNIPMKFLSQEPNYEKLQSKVKYYDKTGKLVSIKPDQAKEIRFKYKTENIRLLSRYNSIGTYSLFSNNQNIFLKLEIDGNLKLFRYYFSSYHPGFSGASGVGTPGGYSYSVERFVLEKYNGILKQPRSISFRKDMMEYFSDCPSLVDKIDKREFRKDDLMQIALYYNKNCSRHH